MRVLGIDPGLRITGYACLEGDAVRPAIVEAGVFRLTTKSDDGEGVASVASRLVELERDTVDLMERVRPERIAVEGLFAHYKHPATAIVMGHGRGVILLCAQRLGIEVVELKPAEVKKAMTGSGSATKEQMVGAAQRVFELPEPPSPPDVADALAIALCALRRELV